MIFQSLVMISTLKDHNSVPRQKLKYLRQLFVAMNMMNNSDFTGADFTCVQNKAGSGGPLPKKFSF